MPYQIFRGTIQDCEDRLNGVLQLGPFPASGLPVGGLTLIFTAPSSTTVTFTGSGGSLRTFAQILADITSQLSAVNPKRRGYDYGPHISTRAGVDPKLLLVLQHDTAITLASTGTANAVFGLSTTATTSVAAIAAADAIHFGPDATVGHYYLVIAP